MSRAVEDVDGRGVAEGERIREALSVFRWPLRLHGLRVLDDTREAMATAYTRDRAASLVLLANAAYRASLALPSVTDQRDALAERVRVLEAAAKTVRADALEEAAGVAMADDGRVNGNPTFSGRNTAHRIASTIRALAPGAQP